MTQGETQRSMLTMTLRFLTFRASRAELLTLRCKHLMFGLVCTWVVGMGRYWDDPVAHLGQKLGLGSVVYVFLLSALLWVVFAPLGARDWSYRRVLTVVTLTAPPAILYAIPVERFTSLAVATDLNLSFLAVVATWRLALFFVYARRLTQLRWSAITVGTLFPLTLIIGGLWIMNLHRMVFNLMGGLRTPATSQDSELGLLTFLTVCSVVAFLPLLLSWLVMVARRPTPGDTGTTEPTSTSV